MGWPKGPRASARPGRAVRGRQRTSLRVRAKNIPRVVLLLLISVWWVTGPSKTFVW